MHFERKEGEIHEEMLPERENSAWFREFFAQRLSELKESSASSLESWRCCLFQTYYLNTGMLNGTGIGDISPSQK